MDLRPLNDDVLLSRLAALAAQERENLADIVEHLMEVDRRALALDRGYPSLFQYCREKLGYSEQAAYSRIRAARAAARFSDVLPRLRSGQIHLDALVRLYPHLTLDNQTEVLDRALGATSREVFGLVAELGGGTAPERDVMRPLPPPPISSKDPEVIAPPSRIRLAFTADEELVGLVDRLRGLLRHRFPSGRLEELFKEAARVLIEKIDPARKRQSAILVSRKRSRRVPKTVKDEVWRRDGGRCAFLSDDGRRCESRDALEYDHIVPWADGGRSDTPDNIRLLCRPHNQRLGRKRFGPRRR